MRISEFSELSPVAKSVWRHYYKKLKKQTRGGKLGSRLDKYLPGHHNAPSEMLFRGTNKAEVEKLAAGRFKSNWRHADNSFPNKLTWVASNPGMAAGYAVTNAEPRMVVVAPTALKRRDRGVSSMVGATTTTAPLRGGIGQREVRGLLKGENHAVERWWRRGGPDSKKWRPVPLGEIQRREFAVHEFGRFAEALAAVRKAKRDIGSRVKLTRIDKKWPLISAEPPKWRTASFTPDNSRPTVWRRHLYTGKKIPTTPPAGTINVPRTAVMPTAKSPIFSYLHEAGHAKGRHGIRKYGGASTLNSSGRAEAPSHWRAVLSQERAANKEAVKWAGPLKKDYRKAMRPSFNTYRKAAMAEMYGIGAPGTTLTDVKSTMKRHPWLRGYGFSRIDRSVVAMSRRENLAKQRRQDPIGREAGIPLTGQIAHDRYVIENRQKDIAKRDSNILRAGVAGAAAGAVLGRGRLPLKARLATGALAGAGSVIGVRAVTHKTGRDVYGARQPWAARSEAAPAVIGTGAAGYGVYRILRKKFLKMSDARFEFSKKEKRQMNPYVMAGLSGAASGAALGILPLLRRGVSLKTALRTAAGGAAVGGSVVGGGSLLGSGILGDPDNKEGAAFTKRAAVGGAIVGGTLGAAGGLVARRVPVVRKQVGKLAREWRPAQWIKKSGPVKAAAIGGVAGGGYGLASGADEGQQVDSIRNIRKDLKRMHGFEFARDWRDARRESRSEAAKDLLAGSGALAAGAGVGAGVGYAGWRAGKAMNQVGAVAGDARKATRGARVASARITRASRWIKRQLTTFPTFRKLRAFGAVGFDAFGNLVELEKPFHGYNKKRHAKTGGLNDSFRAKYNREHGSNLKRPVTKDPSKLKPGSKAAKRRASFCARMGGMPGPTSKDGKLTPKGAALKRWNCSAKEELIEMNDKTYRPGSTAEMRSMKQTPAIKEMLTKENARGKWKHRLRTLMKVLPFEARYEFQTMAPPMAPMNPVYDERERLKRQLLVTGAVATPVAGVGYAGWRSLRKSADAMRTEEARMKLGRQLRADRRASMSVGGKVNNARFGPRGPIEREPLPIRKSMQPETLERNQATNKAIAIGKRYESEINNRYRAGSKMKMVHSRGERKAMRATLAMLRTKYKFARKGAVHQFAIYARDQETGRAAGFYDYVQGRSLTRKNPVTGSVEAAPITTGAFISAARRKAEEYNRTRKRGMGLVRDVSEVSQGKKTKKREWEKSWFQNKLQTAAGAAALLGAGVVYRKGGLRSAPGWAKAFRRGTDKAIGKAQNLRATAEDRLGKIMGLSARLKNSVRTFDMYQDYYNTQGWDLRDARGNSARVFSPSAKKRKRRPAEWYEKKEGERKILGGLALAGTIAGTAGGLLVGGRVWGRRGYKIGYDRGVTSGMGQKLAADIIKKENKALRERKRKIIQGPWKDKRA